MQRCIQEKNSVLESKDGQYLINPAVVELNMINAKDKEDVIKIGLKYGAEKSVWNDKKLSGI